MSRQTPVQRKLVRTAAGFNGKARKLGSVGVLTAADLGRIILAANGQCYYCGMTVDPMSATFDHIVPFESGGSNLPDNIALSCITDNRQKFTMSEAEYREWLALERRCLGCGVKFKPRAADYRRGFGFYHSRACSGRVGGTISRK